MTYIIQTIVYSRIDDNHTSKEYVKKIRQGSFALPTFEHIDHRRSKSQLKLFAIVSLVCMIVCHFFPICLRLRLSLTRSVK